MSIENKIKHLYLDAMWNIISSLDYRYNFDDLSNVEKFIDILRAKAGSNVEIQLVSHIDGCFDIKIDHKYHIDITNIGVEELK